MLISTCNCVYQDLKALEELNYFHDAITVEY